MELGGPPVYTRRIMISRIVKIAVLLLLIVGALLLWRRMDRSVEVETILPARMDVVETVVASGQIRPGRQVGVGFDVAGTVEAVTVAEGERVAAGQVVALLRSEEAVRRVEQAGLVVETARRELEAARRGPSPEELRRARAEVARLAALTAQAAADLSRNRSLAARGAIPAAEAERAAMALAAAKAAEEVAREAEATLAALPREEDVRVAEARLREAEGSVGLADTELARRALTAPFAGLVARRLADPGLAISPGAPVILLADLARSEIRVDTDETNLARLRIGQSAQVYSPAYRAEPFAATLTRIGPEVDPQRGVVGLVLTAGQLPSWALLSMTVDVTITVGTLPGSLTLPATAVVTEGAGSWVLLAEDGVAVRRAVTVTGRSDSRTAVTGLDPALPVLLRGTQVPPGTKISPRAAGG
jgi:HlyD family secretion protein